MKAHICAVSFFSASLISRSCFFVGSYDKMGESLDEKSESSAGVSRPAASMRQITPVYMITNLDGLGSGVLVAAEDGLGAGVLSAFIEGL